MPYNVPHVSIQQDPRHVEHALNPRRTAVSARPTRSDRIRSAGGQSAVSPVSPRSIQTSPRQQMGLQSPMTNPSYPRPDQVQQDMDPAQSQDMTAPAMDDSALGAALQAGGSIALDRLAGIPGAAATNIGTLMAAGATSLPGVAMNDVISAGLGGAVKGAMSPLGLGLGIANAAGGALVSHAMTSDITDERSREAARAALSGTGLIGHGVALGRNALSRTSLGSMLGLGLDPASSLAQSARESSELMDESNVAFAEGEIDLSDDLAMQAARSITGVEDAIASGQTKGVMARAGDWLGGKLDAINADYYGDTPSRRDIDMRNAAALALKTPIPSEKQAILSNALPTLGDWLEGREKDNAARDVQGGVSSQNDRAMDRAATKGESDDIEAQTGRQGNNAGGGGAGGGGGGLSVLCTALYLQGMLPPKVYWADHKFGLSVDKKLLKAYQIVAAPLAQLMLRSKLVTAIVRPFVSKWAHWIAKRQGVK